MAKPVNVRIVREDGSVLPVELTHVGMENGVDLWEIAGVVFHAGRDTIEMDELPSHTSIRFTSDVSL